MSSTSASQNTTSLRPPSSTPSGADTSSSGTFNLKEWLEFEIDVLGFFKISRLIVCVIALVLACCLVCCVLGCIRYQFLKAKRKIKEKLDARNERVTARKKAKENKKAIVEAWTETIDQHSKATCYHNTITNETTWDKPAGYRKRKKGAKQIALEMKTNPMTQPGGAHARTETRLPTNWTSEFSPEGYKVRRSCC